MYNNFESGQMEKMLKSSIFFSSGGHFLTGAKLVE